MFFRALAPFTVFFAFALGLAGCSLYEGPPPSRKKDFSQGSLGCLKEFNAKLVLYFDGKLGAEEVNRLADCSIKALHTFGDLVHGEKRDRFTAQEVRDFMQRYFLDDVVFSDALLSEIMLVKQTLVGGETADFTHSDLKEAEGLVNIFRDVFLHLRPLMPLSLERLRHESTEYVDEEARVIQEIGELFGRRITERDSAYSFEEMGRLFNEIGKTFPAAAETMERIHDHLQVAGILKEVLISPDHPREKVTAAEWRVIFQDGSRWIGIFLKFKNLEGKFPDWTKGEGRVRFSTLLGESLDLLDRVVSRHCPKGEALSRGGCRVVPVLPFTLVQEVIESVDWDGTISGIKFEKSTLKKLLEPFFVRFLGGTDLGGTGRGAVGITLSHLNRARSAVREWMDGLRYVEGVYTLVLKTKNFSNEAMVPTRFISEIDVREALKLSGGVTDAAVATGEGLRDAYVQSFALLDATSAGAIFDGKNRTRDRVFRELVRYTWLRPLLKTAVLGYMKGLRIRERARFLNQSGLERTELRDLITDYWSLLLDFKIVGPKNSAEEDSKKRFREAALFTSASDGNDLISIEEGTQLVLYVLSGDPMGSQVHERASKICERGGPDDFGEPTIEPSCYREKIYDLRSWNKDAADVWRPFSALVHFYERLSDSDQSRFRSSLEIAVRKSWVKPEDYFTSDDSDTAPLLFHYVEAVFTRFDLDGDGLVSREEAEKAYPIFRHTLSSLSGLHIDDPKLPSVFYYLLAKGSPPVDDSMGGWSRFWRSATFLWWHKAEPKFEASRLRLLEVFAALSRPSGT